MDSPNEQPLFSLPFTIMLAVFLMLPLLLRTVVPGLEPYPAIMLPAGSSKVDLSQNAVPFTKIRIMGQTTAGTWVEVDPNALLDPIPIHYLYVVSEEDFGLKLSSERDIKSRIFEFSISAREYTPEEIAETQEWLSLKLEAAGLSGDRMRIMTVESELNLETYNVEEVGITNERTIELR